MQITEHTTNSSQSFEVISDTSNNIYNVVHNPDHINQWQCNCIAGSFDRICKHVKAVKEYLIETES